MSKQPAVFEAPSYAPSVSPEIQEELLAMEPAVFLRFSREKGCWEIWCKLEPSRHPDARNELADADRWNTDHQCWMRFLQNYRTADGHFAPADRALIKGLKMADAWARRDFYEEHVERVEQQREEEQSRHNRQMFGDAANYYRGLPNPIVAPYGRAGKADWRQGSMY